MWFTGTALNFATVLAGGLLGTFLGDRLPTRLRENAIAGVGLFTTVMGVKFAIDTANLLVLLSAIVIGGAIGSLAGIERRLNALGADLQRRLAIGGQSPVAEGFVTASIVFCVGPLTFLGAIRNGLTGDASLLAIKSVLDGLSAIAFAATLGWGVLLSLIVIVVYQGGVGVRRCLVRRAAPRDERGRRPPDPGRRVEAAQDPRPAGRRLSAGYRGRATVGGGRRRSRGRC